MTLLMAAVRNVLMGTAIVCVQSNALAHGQSAKQTAATKNIRSRCLPLVLVRRVRLMMALRLRAAPAKASARPTQIAPDTSSRAPRHVRSHQRELGSKLWRSQVQGRRVRYRRTAFQVKAAVLPT